MIDWLKYHFSASYLFQANPHDDTQAIYWFIFLFLLVLLSGLIANIILRKKSKKIKPYKDIAQKISNYSLWIGLLGLIYIFFRWQRISHLSSPIILLLIILLFIYFSIKMIIYTKKDALKQIQEYKQELKYQKYLPKNKK